MTSRELSPADHIAQYALLSRLIAAAVAVAAAGGFDHLDRGRVGLAVSIVVIVTGNYVALRRWPYVVDTIRIRDKPLYLVLDIALALSVILIVGAASPLVLYLVGSVVLAGLIYAWRFAVVASIVVTGGYLSVLFSGQGAVPGSIDVHSVFTLPALMLGAGPAASAVRRLLRLRDQDAQAVGMLKSQMAVREERLRLSRDMHDTITKNLHGLSLLAGGLTRCLDRGRLEQARDTAELVGLTARQLADSSRSVILDLRERPDPDLARALQDVVRTALAGHDMMLSWRMSDEVADRARTLGTEASSEILAVVGEAVHNVVKHAAAQSLVVGGELEGDTSGRVRPGRRRRTVPGQRGRRRGRWTPRPRRHGRTHAAHRWHRHRVGRSGCRHDRHDPGSPAAQGNQSVRCRRRPTPRIDGDRRDGAWLRQSTRP